MASKESTTEQAVPVPEQKLSPERILQLLAIEAKDRTAKDKATRYWKKQAILLRKAEAAGLTVTEAEIDAEIERTKKAPKA